MSSNAYAPPLHVVPDVQTTKARWLRFGVRQELRRRAYLAYYKALSLARSAVGWALRQIHRGVEATGSVGIFSWLSGQARNAVGLIREAGIVPSVLAVLSAPPITAAAVRVARSIGRGVVRISKVAWTGIKSLLGRCGTMGAQIVETLTTAGTQVAETLRAVAKHPLKAPVVHALKATLALVHPVSSGLVTHRLLQALIPVVWFRLVFEFLFMPFLVDFSLVSNVWDWDSTPNGSCPTGTDGEGTDDAQGDLVISTLGNAIPMPGREVPGDVEQPVAEEADVVEPVNEEPADEDQHLNRASRRAQQREDAHAWRMQHPRR
jgi:hypothetical protein